MKQSDYVDVILATIRDTLPDLKYIDESYKDMVWQAYNRAWCLIQRVCDNKLTVWKRYSERVDEFFLPYMTAIQPIKKDAEDQNDK